MAIQKGVKWALGALGVLGVLVVGGSVAYGAYYAGGARALPHTYVGNVDVSGMKQQQIVQALEQQAQSVQIQFSGSGINPPAANLQEVGLSVDYEASAQAALAPSYRVGPYFTAPFTATHLKPVVKLDETKYYNYVQALSKQAPETKVAVEPYVKPTADYEKFELVKGVPGSGFVPKQSEAEVRAHAEELKSGTVQLHSGEVPPLYTDAQAQAQLEQVTKLAAPTVTLTFADQKIEVSRKDRNTWVTIPGLVSKEQPKIDPGLVQDYLENQRESLEVERKDATRYVNPDGDELKVTGEMRDGVQLANLDTLAQAIAASLDRGQAYVGQINSQVDKAQYDNKVVDWGAEKLGYWASPGEKWIDVNLTTEMLTYYEGGKAVRGPIKIVPGAASTPTVEGLHTISRKLPSRRMRMWDSNGELLYDIPDVPWVMYFYTGGYAFHGAPWRGGNMYRSGPEDGSHGCVSMTVAESKRLYDWTPVGTKAYIHR